MSVVTSRDGTHIAYERAGSGPPLVLIDAAGHFRANSALGELADLLTGDFTVYRYDRRGRGESGDTPSYAPAREVEDIAALVAAAGAPVALYGYSSGCLVALHAAAAGLDVRRLVLLEPPIGSAEGSATQRAFTAKLRELSGEDAVTYFLTEIGVPDELLAGMRGTPHWQAMVSVAHTLAYDSELSEATTSALLSRVTAPALVLASSGSGGELTGMAASAAAALPHAVHRSLAGEWHSVPATALAPVVTDFLR
ncbi:alpha/beta fold hydrolase [Micromonospora halophytica]|uniref:Pimeloyl-ACP methyl ester carboxylesterase n=1 Tax=Micromonospora halophytica TaxID=47864 RepID=A0A1C5J9I9_9ACTN|nr:alpha/beta hydrolase [Micromonospora halophytica]SCG67284.1 Pimeloyl-ACP methyl ester carboxylesterase [Micromonospora halophytica]